MSRYDICECGDYRQHHEGGTGRCTFPADELPGHEPCRRFRIAMRSRAGSNEISNEGSPVAQQAAG